MQCERSTAQSKPGVGALNDSLRVVREFAFNAKPLLDSLTTLHFRRLEIIRLKGKLADADAHVNRLAEDFARCRESATGMAFDAFDAKNRAGGETIRRRRWQAATLLGGAAVGSYIGYRTYRTLSLRWLWCF